MMTAVCLTPLASTRRKKDCWANDSFMEAASRCAACFPANLLVMRFFVWSGVPSEL